VAEWSFRFQFGCVGASLWFAVSEKLGLFWLVRILSGRPKWPKWPIQFHLGPTKRPGARRRLKVGALLTLEAAAWARVVGQESVVVGRRELGASYAAALQSGELAARTTLELSRPSD